MSIDAVADAGITLRAAAPTSAARSPRTLSEGSISRSSSRLPGTSAAASPSRSSSAGSTGGIASSTAWSVGDGGRVSAVNPSIVTRPVASFIEASSRASSSAGLGAQLP